MLNKIVLIVFRNKSLNVLNFKVFLKFKNVQTIKQNWFRKQTTIWQFLKALKLIFPSFALKKYITDNFQISDNKKRSNMNLYKGLLL